VQGYRDVQCGWILPTQSPHLAALGLLLVLYAPRRQSLEIWTARSGQRLVSVTLAQPCRLLAAQQPFHSWNNAVGDAWRARCPPTTHVLETGAGGGLWDAAQLLQGVTAAPASSSRG
jgi:hypothetical protein